MRHRERSSGYVVTYKYLRLKGNLAIPITLTVCVLLVASINNHSGSSNSAGSRVHMMDSWLKRKNLSPKGIHIETKGWVTRGIIYFLLPHRRSTTDRKCKVQDIIRRGGQI